MKEKLAEKYNPKDDESKGFAFLGVFLTVIGFLIVLLTQNKDRYAMFYAKQGLVLFIGFMIASIVHWIFAWIPIVGWIVYTVTWIIVLVLWVQGLFYSLSGKEKDIFLIGELAKKIKL